MRGVVHVHGGGRQACTGQPDECRGAVREHDVERPETTGVRAGLEDVLDREGNPATLDHTPDRERALAFLDRQTVNPWDERSDLVAAPGKAVCNLSGHSGDPVPCGIPGTARDENAHLSGRGLACFELALDEPEEPFRPRLPAVTRGELHSPLLLGFAPACKRVLDGADEWVWTFHQ